MIEPSPDLPFSEVPAPSQEQAWESWVAQVSRRLRQAFRLSCLALWGAQSALDFLLHVGGDRHRGSAARRAWQRRTARRALAILKVEAKVEGYPPRRGLLVCNHLGYLDVAVLAAIVPAVFVAKIEGKNWPVFGWLARCGGTIFVNRQCRQDVGRVIGEIHEALESGATVILFPEGTSSSGASVLPFRSSLLEPVRNSKHLAGIASLDYHLPEGSVEQEVCYWGDHRFGSHLLNLLSKRRIQATLRFGQAPCPLAQNRKQLAIDLRESVARLRKGSPAGRSPFHEKER